MATDNANTSGFGEVSRVRGIAFFEYLSPRCERDRARRARRAPRVRHDRRLRPGERQPGVAADVLPRPRRSIPRVLPVQRERSGGDSTVRRRSRRRPRRCRGDFHRDRGVRRRRSRDSAGSSRTSSSSRCRSPRISRTSGAAVRSALSASDWWGPTRRGSRSDSPWGRCSWCSTRWCGSSRTRWASFRPRRCTRTAAGARCRERRLRRSLSDSSGSSPRCSFLRGVIATYPSNLIIYIWTLGPHRGRRRAHCRRPRKPSCGDRDRRRAARDRDRRRVSPAAASASPAPPCCSSSSRSACRRRSTFTG